MLRPQLLTQLLLQAMPPQLGSAQASCFLPPFLVLGRGKVLSMCVKQQGIPDNEFWLCEQLQAWRIFKIYWALYQCSLISCQQKDSQISWKNRMGNPEIHSYTHGNSVYNLGGVLVSWQKADFFNRWYWHNLSGWKKIKLGSIIPYMKINPSWIKDWKKNLFNLKRQYRKLHVQPRSGGDILFFFVFIKENFFSVSLRNNLTYHFIWEDVLNQE